MDAFRRRAFHRQWDILTPEDLRNRHVDIVGAGALGGAIALCITKMGFGISNRVTVTDFDRCEAHNLGTQWFRQSHVLLGEPKVDALGEMLALVCEREIVRVPHRFRGDEARRVGPLVVLAVDSLEERRCIWDRLKRRTDVRFLVDARMGAEVLEIHTLDVGRDDRSRYERSLETDGDPFSEPCTRRAVLYTVLGGAAFVGSVLRAYVRGETYPRHVIFDFRNFLMETRFDQPPARGQGAGPLVRPKRRGPTARRPPGARGARTRTTAHPRRAG